MEFSKLILKWYDKNKRILPWRSTKNPYKIWVSEIILQQTRMVQGISYYHRFINRFPDLVSLANADEREVLILWQGLGYYSRARNLHYSAKFIHKNLDSKFPDTYKEIVKLKGVGDYTASAISSICFNEKTAVLDGNVFRVLSRIFEIKSPINLSRSRNIFKSTANQLMPDKRCGDYNQALMDFGSLICKPQNPLCSKCVMIKICGAYKNNLTSKFPIKEAKSRIKTLFYDYFIFQKNNKKLIVKIDDGIWKSLFQFPAHISQKKQTKKQLIDFLGLNYNLNNFNISLLNSEIINHKLTHLNIKSRFWKVKGQVEINQGVYTDDFTEYPISKLMQKFIEKYDSKLSVF